MRGGQGDGVAEAVSDCVPCAGLRDHYAPLFEVLWTRREAAPAVQRAAAPEPVPELVAPVERSAVAVLAACGQCVVAVVGRVVAAAA